MKQVKGSPAHLRVGPGMENLFIQSLCQEIGFEGLKKQNVQKIGELL